MRAVCRGCSVLALTACAFVGAMAQSNSSTGAAQSAQQAPKTDESSAQNAAPGSTPVGGDVAAPEKKCDTALEKDKKTDKPGCEANVPAVDPAKMVEIGSQMEKIRAGSRDDVSAVGNRDIGGRGLGNWYSTDYEIKLGRTYSAQVEKSAKFITDPVVTEYVNRIGQNIVRNSDCRVPFTIKVIDSDEINAMALPGGFFYVNSGLILNADEESELAGVMAHETAHVCAHHAVREMTRASLSRIGMVPVMILVGGWTGYGIYEGSQLMIPVTFLKFSREFETEADYLGVQYMYRAGYDPQAFISFFEKIEALQKHKPGMVNRAFSDHPQTPERILHSQDEIAHILPAREQYIVTTSEFDDVKARLARIENKRRLSDSKARKPSLRKSGSSEDKAEEKSTLHPKDKD